MSTVRSWREQGLSACYTVDAGPNAHVLCPERGMPEVASRLRKFAGVKNILVAPAGGSARLIDARNTSVGKAGGIEPI